MYIMNNRTIAVVKILFGNIQGAGFEMIYREYRLQEKEFST